MTDLATNPFAVEAEPFSVPEHCPYCDTQVIETDIKGKYVNGIRPAFVHEPGCEFCNPRPLPKS